MTSTNRPVLLALALSVVSCSQVQPIRTSSSTSPAHGSSAPAAPTALPSLAPPAPCAIVDFPRSDRILAKVTSSLPSGWIQRCEGAEWHLIRERPVEVRDENNVNAPGEWATNASPATAPPGTWIHPRLVFRLAPRWTDDQLTRAKSRNQGIYDAISGLGRKHGIQQRLDAVRRNKNPDPRVGATPEQKNAIEAYELERQGLEKTLIRLPDYQSEHFALFFERHEGWSTGMQTVVDQKAVEECYRVDGEIRRVLSDANVR